MLEQSLLILIKYVQNVDNITYLIPKNIVQSITSSPIPFDDVDEFLV